MNDCIKKNRGKSMIDMMTGIPEEIFFQIAAESEKIVNEALSEEEILQFIKIKTTKLESFKAKDFSELETQGFNSKPLLDQQIEWAASFDAFSEIKTEEIAIKVFRKIVESSYPLIFALMMPSDDDLKECDDPFLAFASWFHGYMDANQKAGLFKYKIIHKDSNVLHFSCSWCVWHHIHQLLGNQTACDPICHADLYFFPGYCEILGADFDRPSALALGSDCCDFTFSRKQNQ